MELKGLVKCEYQEIKDLVELVEHPRNTRKHSKEQIEYIARLYQYTGIRHPIIISERSRFIVAGHARKKAAELLGLKEFPVDIQEFESEAEEYAFLEADNNIAELAEHDRAKMLENVRELGPDIDIEMLGLPDLDLGEIDGGEFGGGSEKDDEVPEVNDNPYNVKRGDIWQLGDHRLMCGDSTDRNDVDKLLAGEKIDMVFTDPPYGINIVGGGKAFGKVGGGKAFGKVDGRGIIPSNTYKVIKGDTSTEVARRAINLMEEIKDIKVQVIWGGNYYAHSLKEVSSWLVWDKQMTGNFGDGELAWTNTGKPLKIFKHTWSGLIKESERKDKRVHPTQKPIALAEWCFNEYAPESKTILDLFLGSGSTLIACEKTNRKCYGIEIDEHYCSVIIKRWEEFTGKVARKME